MYVGGGTGGDLIEFFWGISPTYQIRFNENTSFGTRGISILYDETELTRLDDITWADANWHKVKIVFFRNQFRVYVDNNLKINFLDTTTRTISGQNMVFYSVNASATNYHRIRDIRIGKFTEGLWSYVGQTSANIMFNGGNVGVNTISPSYTLDVSGDINFTGNLRQNGSIFSTSQWTTTAGNVSYTSGSVVVGTVVSAGTMLVSPNATIANINASTGITAGTIVASTITAGTVTAANIGAPTISAGTLLSGIINAKAANPQIKVYHTTPGNETSIYYDAGSVNSHWYVGQNVGSVGVGSFAFFNSKGKESKTRLHGDNWEHLHFFIPILSLQPRLYFIHEKYLAPGVLFTNRKNLGIPLRRGCPGFNT
jgi:hypothetical protein